MYPVSAAFKAALAGSHVIAVKAELYGPRNDADLETVTLSIATIDDKTGKLASMRVASGQVTVDRTAAIRRRCSLTLAQTADDPVRDLLNVYGQEIRLWRGVALAGGVEYAPLGVFVVEDVDEDDTDGGLETRIQGFDRAWKVARAKLTSEYRIAAGTNVAAAIQDLISSRVAGLTFRFMTTTYTTPLIILDLDADPWKAGQDMAAAIGAELFFDVDGVCVLQPQPDPNTSPIVASYAEGAQSVLLGVTRALSNDPGYNHWVVTGENTTAAVPVRAESFDDDPSSPTYYLGAYGDVPQIVHSQLVTTTPQAQAMADGLKRDGLGATEAVRFRGIVNPAHDAGDVVQIVRARGRVSGRYLLESFDVPLTAAGAMQATTRRRQV